MKPSVGDRGLVIGLVLMTFHYFGGCFGKPSVGDSCLVTGLPLTTFHYFGGLLWGAFRRCQLLGNQVTVDDFPLVREVTGSLPSGTAAQ